MMSNKPKLNFFLFDKLPILKVPDNSYYPLNSSLDEELRRLFSDDLTSQIKIINPEIKECNACRCLNDTSLSNYCDQCQRYKPVANSMDEFRKNGVDYEYISESDEENTNGKSSTSNIHLRLRLRPKKYKKAEQNVCVFCKNNGEHEFFYKSHILKNSNGRVQCPILRHYVCPICGATGDIAHTTSHCPLKLGTKIIETNGGIIKQTTNYNEITSNKNYDERKSSSNSIIYDDKSLTSSYITKPSTSSYREWTSSTNFNHIAKPISLSLFLRTLNSNYDDRSSITTHCFSNLKRISTGKQFKK
ncbi:PREDICTED: uncharacterized protein LOC107070920 [Polistes dominula]|uniref:Uncharacterized protein LOC107070920 n=1 Tax=Polistes dominula TaxID=743375 RepID=A0ABM1IXM7_POLDO|nr:PREDICTED: uncharacterized protein LOC107070920 [Polistes dominula]